MHGILFRPRDKYGRLVRRRPRRRHDWLAPEAVGPVPDEAFALARAQMQRGRRVPGDFVGMFWGLWRRRGLDDAAILARWAEYLERA